MKLTDTTRRYFKFTGVNFKIPLTTEGVKQDADVISFARVDSYGIERQNTRTFETVEDCTEWMENKMSFEPNKRQDKVLHPTKAKSSKVSDEDWELMKKFMPNPDNLEQKDFRVFESYLAHNFVDRDGERFSKEVLESLSKTIVGKQKLHGHQWGPSGNGRFFKSHIEKLSIDESLGLIGPSPNPKIKEHLQEIAKRDGGIYWMVPSFYLLTDEHEEIRKIDAGIIGDMSIGFSAPDLVEIFAEEKNGDKQLLWREYRNKEGKEAEAYEASDVFLGAQPGARIRKDIERDEIKTAVREVLAESKNDISEAIMELEITTLEIKETVDTEKLEESLKEVATKIEEKALELLQSAADTDQELKDKTDEYTKLEKEFKDFKAILGDEMTVEKAKVIKETAEAYRDFLVAESIKFARLIDAIEKDQVDEKKELWAKSSLEELKDRYSDFVKRYNEKFKNYGQIEEADPENPEPSEEEDESEVDTRHIVPR